MEGLPTKGEIPQGKVMVETLVYHLAQAKDLAKEDDKFLQVEKVGIEILIRVRLHLPMNAVK